MRVSDPTWGFSSSSPEATSSKEFKYTEAAEQDEPPAPVCVELWLEDPPAGATGTRRRQVGSMSAICWPRES